MQLGRASRVAFHLPWTGPAVTNALGVRPSSPFERKEPAQPATSMSRPLRILHVIPWLLSGGVERRRLELARHLDPAQYRQRVVCLTARPHLSEAFEHARVPVDIVGVKGQSVDLRTMTRATSAAIAWKPDIIHGAVSEGVILATIAAKLSNTPRLILEEIAYPIGRSWRGKLVFRTLARYADACVAVSPAVEEYLATEAGVPRDRVRLIVNGISAPQFSPASERSKLKASLGIPESALVVGSVGRVFDDHKRFSDLIRALHLLGRPADELHLVIVGEGPDLGQLKALADELGVRDAVTFAGYQKDTGPFYSVMDVFALASNRESFGVVLVEAMFAGLPVVATRAGGIPNIVLDGETGILVPVGQPERIAEAIRRLSSEPGLRRRYGEAGRQRAEQRFGASRYVADVRRLYDELSPPRD